MEPVNAFDFVALALLALGAMRGARRGALVEVAGFGGAVAGLLTGARIGPSLAEGLLDDPTPAAALLTLGVVFACLLVGQALGASVGVRLRRAVSSLGVAPVDRIAGAVCTPALLGLLVWLLASALAQAPYPELARQARQSRIVGTIDDALPPAPDVVARLGTYLDPEGFPQVFADPFRGNGTPPPGPPPDDRAARAAAAAGRASTVHVLAHGCEGVSSGSGFVTQPNVVVTNAHVVAGADDVVVRDRAGTHDARAVLFDPGTDLAVLSVPGLDAPPIAWEGQEATGGTQGATLGYPRGRGELTVRPATVRQRITATGRDIYGQGQTTRDVLVLSAPVRQGDSGGPFVTADGAVAGVVFAGGDDRPGVGYALAAQSVRGEVAGAVRESAPVGTGDCR